MCAHGGKAIRKPGRAFPPRPSPAGTWILGLSLHSRETTNLHCARLVCGVPSRQRSHPTAKASPHTRPPCSASPCPPRHPARPTPPPSRALQPGPTFHQGCIGAPP